MPLLYESSSHSLTEGVGYKFFTTIASYCIIISALIFLPYANGRIIQSTLSLGCFRSGECLLFNFNKVLFHRTLSHRAHYPIGFASWMLP